MKSKERKVEMKEAKKFTCLKEGGEVDGAPEGTKIRNERRIFRVPCVQVCL